MGRGGSRKGAGRKKGSATVKTREIADRIVQEGLSPLEVIMIAMREHVEARRWDQAASIAKDAAPYIHPKLAAIEHTGKNGAVLHPPAISVNFVIPHGGG